jgi:DNA-binding CsgD family transcriptional regulator
LSTPPEHAPSPHRDRSLRAQREARERRAERERRIVGLLKQGLGVSEIAAGEGITVRGMRKAIRRLIARRAPEATSEFVAVQASRLNEALRTSYEAMSGENLAAVDRVVRIVRELDLYHGLVGADGTERRQKLLKSLDSGADEAVDEEDRAFASGLAAGGDVREPKEAASS